MQVAGAGQLLQKRLGSLGKLPLAIRADRRHPRRSEISSRAKAAASAVLKPQRSSSFVVETCAPGLRHLYSIIQALYLYMYA